MNNNANNISATLIWIELSTAFVWILSVLKNVAAGIKDVKSMNDNIPLWVRQNGLSNLFNAHYSQPFFNNIGRISEQLSQKFSIGFDIGDCNFMASQPCTNEIQSKVCREFITRSCYKNGDWISTQENCKVASELLLQLNTTIIQYGADRDIIRALELYFWLILASFLAVIFFIVMAAKFHGHIDAKTISYVVAIPLMMTVDVALYCKFSLELFKHDLLVLIFIGISVIPVILIVWEWTAPVHSSAKVTQANHTHNRPQTAAQTISKLSGLAYVLVFAVNCVIIVNTRSAYLRSANMPHYGPGFLVAPSNTVINDVNIAWLNGTVRNVCRNVKQVMRSGSSSTAIEAREVFSLLPGALDLTSSPLAKETYWFSQFRLAASHCHADSSDRALHALCQMYLCGNSTSDMTLQYGKYLYDARADVAIVLDVLRSRLRQEGLALLDPRILENLDDIEYMLSTADIIQDDEQLLKLEQKIASKLVVLQSLVRPFDFQLFLRILAANEMSLMQDDEPIFIVGPTRVGKTTVVLWLCGADICETDVNGAHYYLCKRQHDKFKPFIVTASTLSETRHVTSITHIADDNTTIMLCDSPGIFDNRLSEIDVANGVGTANAMRKCKSLRFAIVISKGDFGNTMLSFQKFGLMMTKMFQPLDQYLDSFQYLFTKFESREANLVHEKIKAFKATHETNLRAEPQLVTLLDDIIKKTEKGAAIMDPKNKTSAKEFLRTLVKLRKIDEPVDVIHNFVLDDSFLVMISQIDIHHRSIQQLFRYGIFELAAFKLNELRRMSMQLQVPSVTKSVTQATDTFCYGICDLERAYITNRKDVLGRDDGTHRSAVDLINSAVDLLALGEVYTSYRRNVCGDICDGEHDRKSGHTEIITHLIPFKGEDILVVMEELEHRFLTGFRDQWYNILGKKRWSSQCGHQVVVGGIVQRGGISGLSMKSNIETLQKMYYLYTALASSSAPERVGTNTYFVRAQTTYDSALGCLKHQVKLIKTSLEHECEIITAANVKERLQELDFLNTVQIHLSTLPSEESREYFRREINPDYEHKRNIFRNAINNMVSRALLTIGEIGNIDKIAISGVSHVTDQIDAEGKAAILSTIDTYTVLDILMMGHTQDHVDLNVVANHQNNWKHAFEASFLGILSNIQKNFEVSALVISRNRAITIVKFGLHRIEIMINEVHVSFATQLLRSEVYISTMLLAKARISQAYQNVLNYLNSCPTSTAAAITSVDMSTLQSIMSGDSEQRDTVSSVGDYMSLLFVAKSLFANHLSNVYFGEYDSLANKFEAMTNQIANALTSSCQYLDVYHTTSVIGCLKAFSSNDVNSSLLDTQVSDFSSRVVTTLTGITTAVNMLLRTEEIKPDKLKCGVLYYLAASMLRDESTSAALDSSHRALASLEVSLRQFMTSKLTSCFERLNNLFSTHIDLDDDRKSSPGDSARNVKDVLDLARRLLDIYETEVSGNVQALLTANRKPHLEGIDLFELIFSNIPKSILDVWTFRSDGGTQSRNCSSLVTSDGGKLALFLCALNHNLETNIASGNYDVMTDLIKIAIDCTLLDVFVPSDFEHRFSTLAVEYSEEVQKQSKSLTDTVKRYVVLGEYAKLNDVLLNVAESSIVETSMTDLLFYANAKLNEVNASLYALAHRRLNEGGDAGWSDLLPEVRRITGSIIHLGLLKSPTFKKYLGRQDQTGVLEHIHDICIAVEALIRVFASDIDSLISSDNFVGAEQLILNMTAEIELFVDRMPCRDSNGSMSVMAGVSGSSITEPFLPISRVTVPRKEALAVKRQSILKMYATFNDVEKVLFPSEILDMCLLAASYDNEYLATYNGVMRLIESIIDKEISNVDKFSLGLLKVKAKKVGEMRQAGCNVGVPKASVCPSLERCGRVLSEIRATTQLKFDGNVTSCGSNVDCMFLLFTDLVAEEHYREAIQVEAGIDDLVPNDYRVGWNAVNLVTISKQWVQCQERLVATKRVVEEKKRAIKWKPNNFETHFSPKRTFQPKCRVLLHNFPNVVIGQIGKYYDEIVQANNKSSVKPNLLVDSIAVLSLRSNPSTKSFFDELIRTDKLLTGHLSQVCSFVQSMLINLSMAVQSAMQNGKWATVVQILNYVNKTDGMHAHGVDACRDVYGISTSDTTYLSLVLILEEYLSDQISFVLQMDYIEHAGSFPQDVDSFYTRIATAYSLLNDVDVLQNHVTLSPQYIISTIQRDCEDHVVAEFLKIVKCLNELIDRIPSSNTTVYTQFYLFHKSLTKLSDIPNLKGQLRDVISEVNSRFMQAFDDMVATVDNAIVKKDWRDTAVGLMSLYDIIEHIGVYENSKLMTRIVKAVGILTPAEANSVASQLHMVRNSQALADKIIDSLDAFEGYALTLFYQSINMRDADVVLKSLKVWENGDGAGTEGYLTDTSHAYINLQRHWGDFSKQYSRFVKDGDHSLKKKALSIIKTKSTYSEKVVGVLACVFASWTLSHSQKQIRPTPAQVIAIFRLLSVDRGGSWLSDVFDSIRDKIPIQNHLMQILTGEGKSVTLAVTGIVLALFGYHVDTVTYSTILRNRDYDMFKDLFDLYGVSGRITYGTYDDIFTDYLNANGNLRELTKATFTGKREEYWKTYQESESKQRVLLLDEVDVFFNQLFYSESYNCLARLRDDTDITSLATYIWNNRATVTYEIVSQSEEFIRLLNTYGPFKEFFISEVEDMISALTRVEHDNYQIKEMDSGFKMIGYIEHDNINTNIIHGYTTMWANFKEAESLNIQQWVRDSSIGLNLRCGSYSYAEVPKSYAYILGTTGTLSSFTQQDASITFSPYNINVQTFIPSVYGESRLSWDKTKNLTVVSGNEDYFNEALTHHLKEIRKGVSVRFERRRVTVYRPVLMIFESAQSLLAYYNSEEFTDLKKSSGSDSVRIITETTSSSDRENALANAAKQSSITLITKSYGRGTDIVSRDDKVELAGGVHVVQCYFTSTVSEEIQNRGRTARQGKRGSFSIILAANPLMEQFQLTHSAFRELIAHPTVAYDVLDKLRGNEFTKQNSKNREAADSLKAAHERSMRFLAAVTQKTMSNEDMEIFRATI